MLPINCSSFLSITFLNSLHKTGNTAKSTLSSHLQRIAWRLYRYFFSFNHALHFEGRPDKLLCVQRIFHGNACNALKSLQCLFFASYPSEFKFWKYPLYPQFLPPPISSKYIKSTKILRLQQNHLQGHLFKRLNTVFVMKNLCTNFSAIHHISFFTEKTGCGKGYKLKCTFSVGRLINRKYQFSF